MISAVNTCRDTPEMQPRYSRNGREIGVVMGVAHLDAELLCDLAALLSEVDVEREDGGELRLMLEHDRRLDHVLLVDRTNIHRRDGDLRALREESSEVTARDSMH